ncbi:MAG: gliding motility-associated ABC transporter ATP-binding subunit GldA [Leptolyngbya sp. SIO3F4]|nr:gliding motility-associated ABC transporter ATP-binding subunit GldA [Leptolyngbya sp. SIO3F4]
MSIQVKGVTKVYGTQRALDDVSFEIGQGEIVGFLGPNGAGKSTMMKIITCYLPQTAGKVEVCGFDVEKSPMDVRKRIGYLPEHNPQYLEMYVREYLAFIAGLYGLANRKQRIEEMIDRVGLQVEQGKKIGALSKGYRQRVGLAQALLHEPDVLVLDEPTSGLDPNQIVEIRNVIREAGREKTVMMSTHIMQEVEAVCDRVIIINRGKIVADRPTGELSRLAANRQVIRVQFDRTTDEQTLRKLPGVERVHAKNDHRWVLESTGEEDLRPRLFQHAVQNGLTLLEMSMEEQNLENIFQQLTREVPA